MLEIYAWARAARSLASSMFAYCWRTAVSTSAMLSNMLCFWARAVTLELKYRMATTMVTEMVSAMVMMISARVAPNGIFLFIGEFLSCGSCPRRRGDGAADLIAATSS